MSFTLCNPTPYLFRHKMSLPVHVRLDSFTVLGQVWINEFQNRGLQYRRGRILGVWGYDFGATQTLCFIVRVDMLNSMSTTVKVYAVNSFNKTTQKMQKGGGMTDPGSAFWPILWWNTHKYKKCKRDAIWMISDLYLLIRWNCLGNRRFICVTKTTKKGKLYMYHLDVLEKLQYIQCINLKWKYNNRSNIRLILFEIYHSLANKYS